MPPKRQIDINSSGSPTEVVVKGVLFLCGFVSVATTAAIIYTLFSESVGFFKEVSFAQFFGDTQ